MSLRIVFAGTPEFACPTLQALLDSSHQVVAVYTQPDRPAGRGRQLQVSPIKQLALANHLPVIQLSTWRSVASQQQLGELNADAMVVVAYGLLLPRPVLLTPRLGCLNVHASLLPRWRGASPIQQAIAHGDAKTGVTIMQMDAGLDTGPLLSTLTCDITTQDNAQSLHDRLAKLGAQVLVTTLNALEKGKVNACLQDEASACYAPKLTKADGLIQWSTSAKKITQRIRAFNPWPVAFSYFNNNPIKIWHARMRTQTRSAAPGTLLQASQAGIEVAAGEGSVSIQECQLPGGKRLSASDFVNAHYRDLLPGETIFGVKK